MNIERPMFLDLRRMKFPPMAIVSIFHRISGVVLFLGLPFVLYLLQQSLRSVSAFDSVVQLLDKAPFKLGVWIFLVALIYHVIAGIRHVLMDMGLGEQLLAGKQTAIFVLVLSGGLALFLGIWLW
jgi:succinate dehydrogenase / fumarate reductase cytochrome b subunit